MMGKMGSTMSSIDNCAVPTRASRFKKPCGRAADLTFTHAGVSIGVCAYCFNMYCCRVPGYELKQICKKMADGKKVES